MRQGGSGLGIGRCAALAPLGVALAASWAAPCPAQDRPAAAPAPAQAQPAPLLREGSYLTAVAGTVHRDDLSGWWRLAVDPVQPGTPRFDLIMLPNRRLDEIRQIVQSAPDATVVFQVTGQVFAYHGRNFLLATHAPQLMEVAEPAAEPSPDLSITAGDDAAGQDVGQIMRELAEAVGPLPRRTAAVGTAPVGSAPAEGRPMRQRRGRLTRSELGAWVFVLEADATGLVDPPLIVMPCLLLERMERHAASAGRTAPILLSGRVHDYAGQSFVLPTLFRAPQDRTLIEP
jgi:hypothetical protein